MNSCSTAKGNAYFLRFCSNKKWVFMAKLLAFIVCLLIVAWIEKKNDFVHIKTFSCRQHRTHMPVEVWNKWSGTKITMWCRIAPPPATPTIRVIFIKLPQLIKYLPGSTGNVSKSLECVEERIKQANEPGISRWKVWFQLSSLTSNDVLVRSSF